ncbi:MAG: DNA replication/repair protein RecF [Anaerolineaceae bacterium]|nr:DNA replication/repair protein RecF [Anaerolineaceae bacterium]
MFLTDLSLTNFRAYTRLDIEVPRRVVLLLGNNAQGKTSLLEAIYYLATFTSFHTQNDRQLINFLAGGDELAVTRIVAGYQRGERRHRLEVRLIQDTNGNGGTRLRKEILSDGVKSTAQGALGNFNAVIFLPQMTRIIEGGPEERRRYLNLTISQAMPGYAQALGEYSQVLSQRNALLKLLAERGGDPEQLVYWDDLLAQKGATLIFQRIHAVHELEQVARRIHHRLSHGNEILRLDYRPSYDPVPPVEGQYSLPLDAPVDRTNIKPEQIRQGFLQRLQTIHREEIARGVTTVGPHRDELRFLSSGVDLGDYGSRGQVRTALLSLKLAEVDWLKSKTGEWPVLLLDEILAELDTQRRSDLLNAVHDSEQALLTTTDLNLFPPAFSRCVHLWRVESGRVRVETLPDAGEMEG